MGLLVATPLYSQTDLILDTQGITLSGYHTYNNISLTNNSTIWIGGYGELTLNADSIFIDETSQINADGVSSGELGDGGDGGYYSWQELTPSGQHWLTYYYAGCGGGGSYGGSGSTGQWNGNVGGGAPGDIYGDNYSIYQNGSRGGDSGNGIQGGFGGGLIIINCNFILLNGGITANGSSGSSGGKAGGGGSGGAIKINSHQINGSGNIQSIGGFGGNQGGTFFGGNGGGGRVTIITFNSHSLQVDVDNGGMLEYFIVPPILKSVTHPNNYLYYNNNNFIILWDDVDNESYQGSLYFFDTIKSTVPTENMSYPTSDNSVAFTNLDEDIYYFHILSVTNSGEVGQIANHFKVNINTSPPDIITSSTHPDSDGWNAINYNFQFSWDTEFVPNDDESFAGYWYAIDQDPLTIPTINDNFVADNEINLDTTLEDGIWYFHVLSEDTAGNLTEEAGHYQFKVDAQSPYIKWSYPENNTWSVPPDTSIVISLVDDGIGVDTSTVIFPRLILTVNDETVEPDSVIGTLGEYVIYYKPDQSFSVPEIVTVKIESQDLMTPVPHTMTESFSFSTEQDVDPPLINQIIPEPGSISADLLQPITIEIMDLCPAGIVDAELDETQLHLTVHGEEYIVSDEQLSWNSPYLEFIPSDNYSEGEISITLSGITDKSGNLMSDSSWVITVDLIPEGEAAGVIHMWDNSALDSVLIAIVSDNTVVFGVFSDINGNFSEVLPIGNYTLSAHKQGYFHYEQDIQINLNETTEIEILLGINGDYDVDGAITFDDLIEFANAWPDDSSIEFGPATGTAPDFTVEADGVLDFEDLMIFTLMWNWWHENNPDALARTIWPDNSTGSVAISINQKTGKDAHFIIQVIPEQLKDFQTSQVILHYNPEELAFEGVRAGRLFTDTSPLLLKVLDAENGLLEIDLAHFGGEKIHGSGVLAEVEFQTQSTRISNIEYFYDLRERDGSVSKGTGVWEAPLIPEEYLVSQNYPNPFNPVTTFRYGLPEDTEVTLTIYNLRGQVVSSLINYLQFTGYHTVQWDASSVGSGIYFYHLTAGQYSNVRKCIVLK